MDEAWEKFVKDPDGADGVVKVILGKGHERRRWYRGRLEDVTCWWSEGG